MLMHKPEEALCRQEGVRQAAFIGRPDAGLGARPHAFVTMEEGASQDEAQSKAAILGMVPYDIAPLVLRIVESLPMTPTGKIAKADIAVSLDEPA